METAAWSFQSARTRWSCNYGNVVRIGAGPEGMSLSLFVLFRPGHAPCFIPWQDFTVASKPDPGWLTSFIGDLVPSHELRFRAAPGIPLLLTSKMVKRLEEASGRRLFPT